MTPSNHRDDIDWLRAVAVLSVCFFHWSIPPFRGGYVGVDVFFVISGFLITRIIQSEVRRDTFSFAQFYERRVRRLLPALYLTVAITVAASFFFLLPFERRELLQSVIATLTFTSNIFFWHQSGYFDTGADEKLLLHTWSLSVEEQFYLALPIVIWLLARMQSRRSSNAPLLPVVLGALALASFAANCWLVATGRTAAAFYLSPFRAWEFLLGSLIAIDGLRSPRNIHLQRTGRIAGLVLIGIAVLGYRASTPFPGVNALLPAAGAALYLWSGISGPAVSRWRWSPVHVANFFGKISYSLYLWHWPLIIYARFLKMTAPLTAGEIAMVVALAVALSYLSYRFVEQPFRRKVIIPGRGPILRWAGGATVLMIIASNAGIMLSSHVSDDNDRLLQSYRTLDYKKIYDAGRCFIIEDRPYEGAECLRMSPTKANILIWGDSAAAQYLYGLRAHLDSEINLMLASAGACFASLNVVMYDGAACRGVSQSVGDFIAHQRPDLAIVAGNWSSFINLKGLDIFLPSLQQTIADLNSRGVPVLLVGPPVQFSTSLPSLIMRTRARNIPLTLAELQQPAAFDVDDMMREKFPSRKSLTYFSVLDAVCPNRQCPVWLEGGRLMSFDSFHLTGEGSLHVAPHIAAAIKAHLKSQPR